MARVWPIICQYGIGAVLCAVGIIAGLKSGYLDLKVSEDKRLIAIFVGGYLLLLAFVCVFTFLAPNWSAGGAQ